MRDESEHPNPYYPFFHLKSEGFWQMLRLRGHETVVEAMTTARSFDAITDNIAWVSLDAQSHRLQTRKASELTS